MDKTIDILIPVYNEGANIYSTLSSLRTQVRTPYVISILYDEESDTTLEAIRCSEFTKMPIQFIRNKGRGVAGAIKTGLLGTHRRCAIVIPADDDYNVNKLDSMVALFDAGYEIVVPSRFMRGGSMVGCPWLKALLVRSAAFLLYFAGRLPTHDSTNGFRLFSRRVLSTIPIESHLGFAYSLELLVKTHRLGWPISEIPVDWYERKKGKSRFQIGKWLGQYLRWFFYGFATTYFRRGPASVRVSANGDSLKSARLSHTPQQST